MNSVHIHVMYNFIESQQRIDRRLIDSVLRDHPRRLVRWKNRAYLERQPTAVAVCKA